MGVSYHLAQLSGGAFSGISLGHSQILKQSFLL